MKQFLTMLLVPVLLCGASAQPEVTLPDYLITEITISCEQGSPAQRQFADQESMGEILQYLRSVALYGKADKDSMDENEPLYTVALTHATGRVTVYRQLGWDFLSKDGSSWYQINSDQGWLLEALYNDLISSPRPGD